MRLNFPDGKSIEYAIPAKQLGDFKPEELVSDELFILAWFVPMKYERRKVAKIDIEGLKRDVYFVLDAMAKRLEDGKIDKYLVGLAHATLRDITRNVLSKARIDKDEDETIMETIEKRYAQYVPEPLLWEMRGKLEVVREMFAEGFDLEVVQRITKLKSDVLEGLRAEVKGARRS